MVNMSSKGISPMIAVVLLIAFTVAVGGIMSVWMTSFTTSTTGNVDTAATNQTKCSGTYIDVISVSSTGIIITAKGSQPISDISCYTDVGGNVTGISSADLAPGESFATTWVRDTASSVVCTGTCLNIAVAGECKSGQTCWR